MHTPRIRRGLLFSLFVLLIAAPAAAHPPKGYPTIGKIDRLDPALDKLIPKDAVIEVLAAGFDWSEGPVWIKNPDLCRSVQRPQRVSAPAFRRAGRPHEVRRIFALLRHPAQLGHALARGRSGATVFMTPSGYTGITPYGTESGCNGIAVDAQGRITFCEHGDRRVSRLEKEGGKRTLADNYQGKRLQQPERSLSTTPAAPFTSPIRPMDCPSGLTIRSASSTFAASIGSMSTAQLTLLTRDQSAPNGIALSPDEKTLYVANSDPDKAIWMAYDVNKDGGIGKGRVFFDSTQWVVEKCPGLPDGLKTDEKGHLFATGPGGVQIFTPAGKHLGTIATGENIANCNWGSDGSTLYITSDSYLCRVRTSTKGSGW